MKTLLRIASYILVLAIGLGAGFYFGADANKSAIWALDIGELNYYSAYMDSQPTEGTHATREEAIHTFLALIEKRKSQPSNLTTTKDYALDSALSYARLAVLAKQRGATQASQQYLQRAESFCPQIGWQQCSGERITTMVQRLDKQGIFKTGGEISHMPNYSVKRDWPTAGFANCRPAPYLQR